MKIDISRVTALRSLKARNEPYWSKVSKGHSIGIRIAKDKTNNSWKARTKSDGITEVITLGLTSKLNYQDALNLANDWFRTKNDVDNRTYTVNDTLSEYFKHLSVSNSESSAYDAEKRLLKHLNKRFLDIRLIDLKARDVNKFKNQLATTVNGNTGKTLTKSTCNRTLNSLKAALNLAYENQMVASDRAWKTVKNFKNADKPRTLFLTDSQISNLLNTTSEAFHNLIRCAVLTGGRYGELTKALVSDFNYQDRTIELTSLKSGTRTTYLSQNAANFIKDITKKRLPSALLLPKDNGKLWGKSHQSRTLKTAVIKAKLPSETVFYSLRHYHISKALLSGMTIQIVADNTGTSVSMIERHYAKFLKRDRLSMMDKVELG